MARHLSGEVRRISHVLSLRDPQIDSLEVLAEAVKHLSLSKRAAQQGAQVLAKAEQAIKAAVPGAPNFHEFERDFPSLTFALATGVGKTRLMGAFVAYLHAVHGVKHFFILAPNLTIYDKLKQDFTRGKEKYVLSGIREFALREPLIIDGDTYTSSAATRGGSGVLTGIDDDATVHINIFNVSKLNKDAKSVKGAAPRIKRLSEYIGQSYFDYLRGLDDLVVLMDESHRYRADAAVAMLNELQPVLGIELTATPVVTKGKTETPFRNVLYDYPLANAIRDGFVKDPAVASRRDFDATGFDESHLQRIKLEDGIRLHESTKAELVAYAHNTGAPLVKPFVLVVASDTQHANDLVALMESDEFFDGLYRGKVITVHSNLKGAESEENIERLLRVEDPAEPTEIVVHVDKLKEGWDVRNLYTIIPLRAANSPVLVEQSIGRGLRLPYGRKTGVAAVDRLTVVSHENFEKIIERANRQESIFRTFLRIGEDTPAVGLENWQQQSRAEAELFGVPAEANVEAAPRVEAGALGQVSTAFAKTEDARAAPLFTTPAERAIGLEALQVVERYVEGASAKTLASPADLLSPKHQTAMLQMVREAMVGQSNPPGLQGELNVGETVSGDTASGDMPADEIVKLVTERLIEHTIAIPRIVVQPVGDVHVGYAPFELDLRGFDFVPNAQEIVGQQLQSAEQWTLRTETVSQEARPENYIIRRLLDYDDVSLQDRELLYPLATRVVAHLNERHSGDASAVENILQTQDRRIAALIHAQLQQHQTESAVAWEANVTHGFEIIRTSTFTVLRDSPPLDYRRTDFDKSKIKQLIFTGFRKALQQTMKFDSDTERKMAVLLERDDQVVRWFRPVKGQLSIYLSGGARYEPDFVVETRQGKYLVEPKARGEMEDEVVLEKAAAARRWCEAASAYALGEGSMGWAYVLVPHDAVVENASWLGVVGAWGERG